MKRTTPERRGTIAMSRRLKAGSAVGALASALMVAGVVGAPNAFASTRHASKVTTITWWASPISTSGPDLRLTEINAFEKANPNIHVKLETAPTSTDTNRADLVTTISGGAKSPDVFMGDVIWPGQFGAHNLALDLSKYEPKSFFNRFAPGLVAGASYKGQVYGAPFFQDQGFLYYRKDLLAADHMSVPTTWEQLKSDAVTLVKQGKVKYGFVWEGASYEGGTCDFMEYYADTGGQVLNATDTKSVLNTAKVTKALAFVRSLVTSGASPAAVDTFQEPQAMDAFQNGQAAFLRNWDYAYAEANAKGMKSAGKVGVAPLPTFAGQSYPGYSTIGGWNLYINPHSRFISADLKFINFITGVQGQNIEAHPPFSEIPTNQAVRSDPKVKALNPPFAILSKTRLIARPAQSPNYPKVSQAIFSNFNSAIAGSKSPSAAASAMASQVATAVSSSSGL
ncbi:MAG: ABC transporter substrate-binding protein [Acidimicrobiales bacterium]|jgi:multiple sugar transport system substrate-binding protein